MSNLIAVLCLLLTTGTPAVLGGDMNKYGRETVTFTDTPDATISAVSHKICAISCTATEPWFCGGFTFHVNGTCDLYRSIKEATCINLEETAPSLLADTGSEPLSYRRLQSACPGTVSDPCDCPAGFRRCAGRCLKFLNQTSTYDEAEAACEALGAHLTVPRSEAENLCAFDIAGGYETWLGVNDRDTEGTFVAVDRDCDPVPDFETWWEDGEPNDYHNAEDCAFISDYTGGQWFDSHCSLYMYPLCQLRSCWQPQCQ